MKLTKRKLFLGLFVALLGTALSFAQPSSAVAANFVDGNGQAATINPGDNTRFVFQDPFNIIDTQAKDSQGNPVVYSTKSTACGNDNMYVCSDGNTFHSGAYWYWPSGATAAAGQSGSCKSALVLHIRYDGGTGLDQSKLFLVNAHQGVQGTGCFVQDTTGKKIATKDIEGWGAKAVDDSNAGANSVDTIVNSSDTIELDKSNTSDKNMFYALATEFQWAGPNEIDSIMHGRKLDKVTDSATLNTVSTDLSNGFSEVKPYASGYDYYVNKECVNDKNQILALLAVKQGDPSNITVIHRNGGDGSKGYRADTWVGDQQSCLIGENHTTSPARIWGGSRGDVTIGIGDVANYVQPGSAVGQGGSGAQGSGETTIDCSYGALTWIACPIVDAASGAVQLYDKAITNELDIQSSKYLNESDNSVGTSYHQVWSAFRYLAMSLLVLIGLVMVISQAIGSDLFDAYTVRKVLPRLLAAVILISLSWPLVKYMIDASDILGEGVKSLIFFPFDSAGLNALHVTGASTAGLTFGAFAVGAALGLAGILLFLLSALLAVFTALVTLVVRKIFIIFLAVLAPIAIVAFILPGTQRIWKMWWDNFLKLLLMFPLIMAFIAAGRVFALSANKTEGSGLLGQIIAFIAYFGPYFALPMTFKMGGGLMSMAAGGIHSMSQMGTKRLNAAGRQQAVKTWHSTRDGNRFKGGTETNLRGRLNRGLEATTNIGAAGLDPRRMRSRMRTALADKAHEEASRFAQEDTAFGAFKGDDAKLWAAKYSNAEDIGAELERRDADRFGGPANARARTDAVAQIMRAQRGTSSEAFQRARVRAQAATGTGYVNSAEMLQDINDAYGNDRGGAGRALAEMRTASMQSGRVDLGAAGYGTMAAQMEALHNRSTTAADATDTILDSAIDSSSGGQVIYGKPQSAEQLARAHIRRVNTLMGEANSVAAGVAAGTHTEDQLRVAERAVKQQMASAAGVYDALAQASPQNARAFANGLTGQALDIRNVPPGLRAAMALRPDGASSATGPISMLQGMENLRAHDTDFAEMRRDYSSQAAAEAAQGAARMGGGGPAIPGGPAPGGMPAPPGTI